jgi:hypothetical protein
MNLHECGRTKSRSNLRNYLRICPEEPRIIILRQYEITVFTNHAHCHLCNAQLIHHFANCINIFNTFLNIIYICKKCCSNSAGMLPILYALYFNSFNAFSNCDFVTGGPSSSRVISSSLSSSSGSSKSLYRVILSLEAPNYCLYKIMFLR